jgi:hypothetical protein
VSLQDIVSVVITTAAAAVTRRGFGVPLILSAHALYTDRVREYEELADLVADGFATTSPEYKAAAAFFAQSPRPEKVKVGRRALKPTLRYTLTPVVQNEHTYVVTHNGTDYEYESDADATATEICDGLRTAMAAATGVSLSGTTTLIISASAAGGWFSLEADADDFAIANDNADPGVATDLAAILLADSDWYGLVSTHKSAAEIAAIAAWVESNERLFLAASSNSDIIGSGTSDVASTLKTAAYARSTVFYHPNPGQFADAAIMGRCLPLDPGSETWKFKTLAGVSTVALTPSQFSNAKGKRAMVYTTVGGIGITEEGVTSSGEYIDVIRFRDWLKARMQEDVFALLARSEKVPYTDAGIAGIESVVRGVLSEGIAAGGLDSDPDTYGVTVPAVADISTADRSTRTLPDVKWNARLAGAVHSAELSGVISV